jgi:hypothetical protein
MVPMKRYESAGTLKKVLRIESDVDQNDLNDCDDPSGENRSRTARLLDNKT